MAEVLRYGAWGHLLKGSSGAGLLQAVEAVAQERRHPSPQAVEFAAGALTAQAAASAGADALSPREQPMLVQAAGGTSSSAMGAALRLWPKTVDAYRRRPRAELGLGDASAVARWAMREGLVDLDQA